MTVSQIETLDECLVAEIYIDRYLWALYQRTPKEGGYSHGLAADVMSVEDGTGSAMDFQ